MSFYDRVADAASRFFSGLTQEDAAKAAGVHASRMEPDAIAAALTDSVPRFNPRASAALAQQLLHELAHGGDESVIAQGAGTTTQVLTAGNAAALLQLIDFARRDPIALKSAAVQFFKKDPEAVMHLTPSLLHAIKDEMGATPEARQREV